MNEMVIRFFIGGVVVSLFAIIGDNLRPKSFAGLFGAAPSSTCCSGDDENGSRRSSSL
jgi:hypothetical protein